MTDVNMKEKKKKQMWRKWHEDAKLYDCQQTKIKGEMKHTKGVCQGVLGSL